jgi:hypothetical protein
VRSLWLFILSLICVRQTIAPTVERPPQPEGCTVGVASARATSDGRPLLWKVRDNSDMPNNSVTFDTTFPHRFVAVTNSGDTDVWMGVNELGFAIVNATSLDLPGTAEGFTNGQLMRYALGTCSTVEEFEHLLDSTNGPGRRTQANFGIIDATGAAVMFETGGSAYWKFDANDPSLSPDGYVLRTNFSLTGNGRTGLERYRRSVNQIAEFRGGDSLNVRTLLRYHARDFSDYASIPLSVPFCRQWNQTTPLGYVMTNVSISRYKSLSAAVITGVKPDEVTTLSTMWTILGQPSTAIAVPYWPVGNPPHVARGDTTSRLYDIASRIRTLTFDLPSSPDYLDTYKLRDECGNGLWAWIFPAEDSITSATERLLESWRRNQPSAERVLETENVFAACALSQLTASYNRLLRRGAFMVANEVPFSNALGKTLKNGSIVQLIWAGADHAINPPNMEAGSREWGMPTEDDRVIGVAHAIGENVSCAGTFQFQAVGWLDRNTGMPAANDEIYVRVFDSDRLEAATHYGDAQLYTVSIGEPLAYIPFISGGKTSLPMKVQLASNTFPAHSAVLPNFPNPFNSSTVITFEIPSAHRAEEPVDLTVYNSLGQSVKSLYSGSALAGRHRIEWDGRDTRGLMQPSGTYFARLTVGQTTSVQRMVLLK